MVCAMQLLNWIFNLGTFLGHDSLNVWSKSNPKIKILSEELDFSLDTYLEECYWIIDPIDGTRSYISSGEEYTVNIALFNSSSASGSKLAPFSMA